MRSIRNRNELIHKGQIITNWIMRKSKPNTFIKSFEKRGTPKATKTKSHSPTIGSPTHTTNKDLLNIGFPSPQNNSLRKCC